MEMNDDRNDEKEFQWQSDYYNDDNEHSDWDD